MCRVVELRSSQLLFVRQDQRQLRSMVFAMHLYLRLRLSALMHDLLVVGQGETTESCYRS